MAKLDEPVPAEMSTAAPVDAWPHVIGAAPANGRVGTSNAVARRLEWTCELPEGQPIAGLLALGELVLAIRGPDVRGGQAVAIIDGAGRHVQTIEGARGDWAIDPRHRVLLGLTPQLDLAAWSLDEPTRPAALVNNRLSGRALDGLRVVDPILIALTRERVQLSGPPANVIVDVMRVTDFSDVRRWGTLRTTHRIAERIASDIDSALIGFDPAGIILVTARELWWGDWHLRERSKLELAPEDSIRPLRLAPRDDGSGWLLVEHCRRRQVELWHIAVGRCLMVIEQAPALLDAGALLVGPDGGVVLTGSREVVSFDPEGSLNWRWPRQGAPGGLIDEHGVTLCSDGGTLLAIDPRGERATVWTAPVQHLGPLAATSERLWIAAGCRVFALSET